MKIRRAIAGLLAALLLFAGFFMAYRVFLQFRENITHQHGEKLSDIANSVDRSAEGYFQLYHDSLEYVTGRRGFVEAEDKWAETGDAEELQYRLEDNILYQDMQARTILAVHDGALLLSADGNMGYALPEELKLIFLCEDQEGQVYLAITHHRELLSYVVLVGMDDFCDYLADGSAVNASDRMLLVDAQGEFLICHHEGNTDVQPADEENRAKAPARQFAWEAVGTDIQKVDLFEMGEDHDTSTMGYALIGNGGSQNGYFTICVMDAYDTYLDELNKDTLWFVISCCVILSGVLLLLFYVSSLSRENRKAAKEMKLLLERQTALEKINQQTQQLAHHQRLETIGTLTSSISHEFNNLLTPIMSYSLLTLEKLPADDEELYDNILEIYNASQKAKAIISRLSDLSRKNSPKTFRDASVDELVKKALDVAMPAKPETVEVKLNLNCWDLRIKANEIQLTQMLLNLILNAFQAMEQGGILEIHTTLDDDCVQIHVSDTGCGIPEEIRPKIFDPFFTTKESGKGTGLGLAIVAQVVEDHMGTIEVSSTPGSGTRFKICLPRYMERE